MTANLKMFTTLQAFLHEHSLYHFSGLLPSSCGNSGFDEIIYLVISFVRFFQVKFVVYAIDDEVNIIECTGSGFQNPNF